MRNWRQAKQGSDETVCACSLGEQWTFIFWWFGFACHHEGGRKYHPFCLVITRPVIAGVTFWTQQLGRTFNTHKWCSHVCQSSLLQPLLQTQQQSIRRATRAAIISIMSLTLSISIIAINSVKAFKFDFIYRSIIILLCRPRARLTWS